MKKDGKSYIIGFSGLFLWLMYEISDVGFEMIEIYGSTFGEFIFEIIVKFLKGSGYFLAQDQRGFG